MQITYNKVTFGKEALDKVYKGAETVAKSVATSLGPDGKCALIEGFGGNNFTVTKDGVSIARAIAKLEDPIENMGANLVKRIAELSGNNAGDGTSTASVLGLSMLSEGRKYLASGIRTADLKKGIDTATKLAVEKINAKSKNIRSQDDIKNIATISSNNDENIGKLVSEAYSQIGEDGILTVDDSKKTETYLEFVEGLKFDNGYMSPYFVNNDKLTCEFKNPYILITDDEINNLAIIGNVLNDVAREGRPILIIASDFGGQTIPALVVNNMNNKLIVCAVKCPEFGEYRKEILIDIATITNGTFISSSMGKNLKDVTVNDLGTCEKIVVTKSDTLIIGAVASKDVIDERINFIKKQIEDETADAKKDKLKKRLASLSGGVCVLRVFANNEVEMKELKDRIEDTICSVKASVKDGIVLGGGVTLLKVSEEFEPPKELTSDQICGFNIVKKALQSPIRQLAENSGLSADVIVDKILKESDGEKSGFNFATKEWDENLFDKVVDPTLVETNAIKNASSVIGLYLTTEVAITTETKDDGINVQ